MFTCDKNANYVKGTENTAAEEESAPPARALGLGRKDILLDKGEACDK